MRKQPLHFRKEEVSYVMQRWKAMDSCALVGVGSVGKSNLIHHLSDPEAHVHYMGQYAETFKSIVIDPNLLAPLEADASEAFRCWAGYELMMHRLYMGFFPFEALGDEATDFFDTYQALQDGSNPLYAYMGLRYFELGLEFFMRRGIKIVFMFDEFEELIRKMPAKFFQTLRGLRDNYKTQIAYLTFSREPLPILIEKMDLSEMESEPFTELFTDNTYFVGPYNYTDAQAMVKRLIKKNPQANYSQYAIDFLLKASGCYAGLLRSGFRSLEHFTDITPSDIHDPQIVRQLAERSPVHAECEVIWKSLTETEQHVLKSIAQHNYDMDDQTRRAVPLLVRKRLLHVDKEQQTLHIEPPIFREFIHTNPDLSMT